MKRTISCTIAALILALTIPALAARAPESNDARPARPPLRWVVPYPAGGGSDFLARTVAHAWTARSGRPIVIDNRPGANTAIGASEVARARPDGQTVLSADNGTLVFNSALYKSLTYDPAKLAPVSLMGRFPMILIAGPGSEVNNAQTWLEQAKAAPKGITYASVGAGSPHHLAMELLKVEAKLQLVHVPYKGAAPALADVAGGQVPVMMVDLAAGAGFIQAGKVRPLAVAHPTRLAQLPDVPTFAELGLPKVQAAALVGLVTTAGTPEATISALSREVTDAIREPAVTRKLIEFGIEPVGSNAADYAKLLKAEAQRWQTLIRDLGITLD